MMSFGAWPTATVASYWSLQKSSSTCISFAGKALHMGVVASSSRALQMAVKGGRLLALWCQQARSISAMGSAEAVVVMPRALVAFTAGAANLALTELRWRKGGEEGQSRRRAKI